jgi:hypothetical protein
VSSPAVSLAFFDPASGLHGTARAGMTLLFEGSAPTTLPEGPEIVPTPDGGCHARLDDRLDLLFEPVCEPISLGDVTRATVCRVSGSALARRIDCLGTAGQTLEAPRWAELDAVRSVSALFDTEHALLALSRRPRGAPGHGQELTVSQLISGGELFGVEDTRLSTVYDGDGRQRSAGFELWLPGEDFPRRASGTAVAGASLSIEGLRVHAAVFRWQMEGREGLGAYELALRDRPAAAA